MAAVGQLKEAVLACNRPLSWKVLTALEVENLALKQQMLSTARNMAVKGGVTDTDDLALAARYDDAPFDPTAPVEGKGHHAPWPQRSRLRHNRAQCVQR